MQLALHIQSQQDPSNILSKTRVHWAAGAICPWKMKWLHAPPGVLRSFWMDSPASCLGLLTAILT